MKIELDTPQPTVVSVDHSDSALVIVDMQNEYIRPDGKGFHARGPAAAAALVPLLALFRRHGSKIIFVQSVRSPDCLEFRRRAPYVVEGTWGAAIIDELSPRPGESVVQKRSHDPFNNTDMERVLARLGLKPARSIIIVGGVSTNGCVDCAVTGLSNRDYLVYVPIDCTASISEEQELMGFAHFFGLGYRENVTPTRSDLIQFKGETGAERPDHAAEGVRPA